MSSASSTINLSNLAQSASASGKSQKTRSCHPLSPSADKKKIKKQDKRIKKKKKKKEKRKATSSVSDNDPDEAESAASGNPWVNLSAKKSKVVSVEGAEQKSNQTPNKRQPSIKELLSVPFPRLPPQLSLPAPLQTTPLPPSHPLHSDLLRTTYSQFKLHPNFRFPDLSKLLPPLRHLFTHDIVSSTPGVYTPTKVTRTLVGDAGSSYKYLGLRIFSHPWNADASLDENFEKTFGILPDDEKVYSKSVQDGFALVKSLDSALRKVNEGDGMDDRYTLTLMNLMPPPPFSFSSPGGPAGGKKSKAGKAEALSVSWHTDSNLKDLSTIGVYWSIPSPPLPSTPPWSVALRPVPRLNAVGIPGIAISMGESGAYFMKGSMNLRFEHAVFRPCPGVGTTAAGERFSSTHRVVKKGGRLCDICEGVGGGGWRKLVEVEFEWVRQFYIQREEVGLNGWWRRR